METAGAVERTITFEGCLNFRDLGGYPEHGERTHGVFAYDVTLRVPVGVAAQIEGLLAQTALPEEIEALGAPAERRGRDDHVEFLQSHDAVGPGDEQSVRADE